MQVLPDLSAFGNYPVFQTILGLAIALIVYLTWARNNKTAAAAPAAAAAHQAEPVGSPELRWALSGHITVMLETIRDILDAEKNQTDVLKQILTRHERDSDYWRRMEENLGKTAEELRTSRRVLEEVRATLAEDRRTRGSG